MFFSTHANDIIKLKLFEAVDDNELEEFKLIFYELTNKTQQKHILEGKDSLGRNLLHRSCMQGNYKIVEVILEFMKELKIDLDTPDKRRYSAANLAVIKGYPEFSVWEVGTTKDEISRLYLSEGTYTRRFLILKALKNFGADFKKYKRGYNSPLHWACYHSDRRVISYFTDKGIREVRNIISEKNETRFLNFYQSKNISSKRNIVPLKNAKIAPIRTSLEKLKNKTFENEKVKLTAMRKSIAKESVDWQGKLKMMTILNSDGLYPIDFLMKFVKEREEEDDPEKKLTLLVPDNEEDGVLTHEKRATKILEAQLEFFLEIISEGKTIDQEGIPLNFPTSGEFDKSSDKQYIYLNYGGKLTNIQNFYHHLLYWAVQIKKKSFIRQVIRLKHVSPFTIVINGKSAFHLACEKDDLSLVKELISSHYKDLRTNQEIPVEKLINIRTQDTYETAFHLSILNKRYDIARFMILYHADSSTYNYRGWQPFQSYASQEIMKIEELWKDKVRREKMKQTSVANIKTVERESFIQHSPDYQYVLYGGRENEDLDKCVVPMQLKTLQKDLKSHGHGEFHFELFESMKNPEEKFSVAIRLDVKLFRYYAEKLKFRIFNRKLGFVMPYENKLNKNDEFEMLRDYQLQEILLYILEKEFNLKDFESIKLIQGHYPLHDLYRRQQIAKFWTLKKLIVTTMIKGGPDKISKINSAFYYLGATVGYLLGFMMLLKSWIQFYILFPAMISIVLSLFIQSQNLLYRSIQNILIVTLSIIIKVAWSKRFQELNYCWDFRNIQLGEVKSEGQFEVDVIAGTITNLVIKTRISQYFRPQNLLVYAITLLPIGLGLSVIPGIISNEDQTVKVREIYLLIYGIICAFYSHLVSWLQVKIRTKYTSFEVDFVLYIINYLAVLFIFMYRFNLTYFEIYFRGYCFVSLFLHVLFYEIFPAIKFYYRRNFFRVKWYNKREELIDQYLRNNRQFGDFTTKETAEFKKFKKRLVAHEQVEYNQSLQQSPLLKNDFFFIFISFLWLTMFSIIGIGYYPLVYFIFLVFKVWLLIKRTLIFSKRPIACQLFDITKWNSVYNIMTIFVPFHIGLFTSLRTEIIETIFNSKNDNLYNLYIFAFYAHVTIVINGLLPLIFPTKPEWLKTVLNNEKVLKEKYNDQMRKDRIQSSFKKLKELKNENQKSVMNISLKSGSRRAKSPSSKLSPASSQKGNKKIARFGQKKNESRNHLTPTRNTPDHRESQYLSQKSLDFKKSEQRKESDQGEDSFTSKDEETDSDRFNLGQLNLM